MDGNRTWAARGRLGCREGKVWCTQPAVSSLHSGTEAGGGERPPVAEVHVTDYALCMNTWDTGYPPYKADGASGRTEGDVEVDPPAQGARATTSSGDGRAPPASGPPASVRRA